MFEHSDVSQWIALHGDQVAIGAWNDLTDIGPGERSMAVRLELLDDENTLTDERIDAAVRSVLDTLSSRLGARLRG